MVWSVIDSTRLSHRGTWCLRFFLVILIAKPSTNSCLNPPYRETRSTVVGRHPPAYSFTGAVTTPLSKVSRHHNALYVPHYTMHSRRAEICVRGVCYRVWGGRAAAGKIFFFIVDAGVADEWARSPVLRGGKSVFDVAIRKRVEIISP